MTVLTIEKLGRKWIQIQGFLVAALFRMCPLYHFLGIPDGKTVAILAGKFHSLSKVAFIVNFTLLQVELSILNSRGNAADVTGDHAQFFFNFGANATTYVRLSIFSAISNDIRSL